MGLASQIFLKNASILILIDQLRQLSKKGSKKMSDHESILILLMRITVWSG